MQICATGADLAPVGRGSRGMETCSLLTVLSQCSVLTHSKAGAELLIAPLM